jgi:hypothetical protein
MFARSETVSVPGDHSSDEELRSVRVPSGIGHAEKSLLGMLQLKVLIRKLVPVYRLSTSAVAFREVSTLDHEVFNDSVEA